MQCEWSSVSKGEYEEMVLILPSGEKMTCQVTGLLQEGEREGVRHKSCAGCRLPPHCLLSLEPSSSMNPLDIQCC